MPKTKAKRLPRKLPKKKPYKAESETKGVIMQVPWEGPEMGKRRKPYKF